MSSEPQAKIAEDDLETAIDQAIAACDGDLRAAIRALIVANNFLESEVSELMKAVSHAAEVVRAVASGAFCCRRNCDARPRMSDCGEEPAQGRTRRTCSNGY
jgi:hypothetical protein